MTAPQEKHRPGVAPPAAQQAGAPRQAGTPALPDPEAHEESRFFRLRTALPAGMAQLKTLGGK